MMMIMIILSVIFASSVLFIFWDGYVHCSTTNVVLLSRAHRGAKCCCCSVSHLFYLFVCIF